MAEIPTTEPAHAKLPDSWNQDGPIPLDGTLERNKFSPGLAAGLTLLAGFLLFQGLATIAALVLLMIEGVDLASFAADLPGFLAQNAGTLLIGNTIGQVIGLALFGIWMGRLHSSHPLAFLRLRSSDIPMVLLSIVGLFALVPLVQWLGVFFEGLPWPDFIREFDESQMELVAQLFSNDFSLLFSLSVVALTPAICEEIFFRGYVQRQLERSTSVMWGIILSGLIFGLFHLRLTQIVPLSLLGLYLAFLVWRTGSLWAPMIVHFLNNALAVIAVAYVSNRPDLSLEDVEKLEIPGYIVILGTGLFVLILYTMQQRGKSLQAHSLAQQDP